jgi:hypothetical protein
MPAAKTRTKPQEKKPRKISKNAQKAPKTHPKRTQNAHVREKSSKEAETEQNLNCGCVAGVH